MSIRLTTLTLIGIILVILRALEVITWSWWLVTLPLWLGLGIIAFVGMIALMFFIFGLLMAIIGFMLDG